MAGEQQDWPNRGLEILLSTAIICIFSTLILTWRIVFGVVTKRKLLVCDYLLIIAAILNIASTGVRFKTVEHALGRHIKDPSIIVPSGIKSYSYAIYLNQIINLIAVAILKYSICTYLLALKFSRVYTVIVWASILMVTVFNLVIPLLGNIDCKPFEANWNRAVKGKCWFPQPQGLTYMQGVSNCVTDVVYVVAPIIYLRAIQLPRRTQWGLRVVFLLGLVATICSIFKTVELDALTKTIDPTWDGVDLTIWSATELSVGVLIASLPPLRKQFDAMFRYMLPSTFTTKSKAPGNSIPLYGFSRQFSRPMDRSGIHDQDDGSSERQILPEDCVDGKITKTVVHEITHTERNDAEKGRVTTHDSYSKISV